MLKKKRNFAWLAVLGLMMAFSRASVAQAQAVVVGVVDEDKLADGFKAYKDAVAKIDDRAQKLDSQIPAREFLNDTEGKTFDTLIAKSPLSADEQKQLDTLVGTGMDRRAKFMAIIAKPNRTEQEAKDMKDMQDTMTKNQPSVRTLSESLLAAIRKQQDDTDADFTGRANQVVAQVAADKKLSLVVRKRAVVWSSDTIDITSEVLGRLNKA